jgi:hypothetical protein
MARPSSSAKPSLLDRVLPGAEDVRPAIFGAATALFPLMLARVYVAHAIDSDASTTDILRVMYGEIEFWTITAFVGAVLLRAASGRWHYRLRVGYHVFCSIVFVLSALELIYLSVTGSRVDFDLLFFALGDARNVAPVVFSEARWWHVAGLGVGLGLGMWPLLLQRPNLGSPWWGRMAVLLLVPTIYWEHDQSRPRPGKTLREAQASLAEQLWWDGVARLGDTETPPAPGDTDPLRIARTGSRPLPNIVLIFLESVGARNTTLYDPRLPTTPNLVDLAAHGVIVDEAYTVVPHTSKALITTLCGNYPNLVTDIREASPGGLPGRCLPDLARELGYSTAFFQTAYQDFERRVELVHEMGFQLFRSRDTLKRKPYENVNYFGIEDRAMLGPGLAWSLAQTQPFLVTYNTLTTHHDYGLPRGFDSIEIPGYHGRHLEQLNAIRYVDGFVGDLVRAYEAAGLGDNTIFVMLGDHGEAFGEHGLSQHDMVIYDEGLRIPMVMYGPGVIAAAHPEVPPGSHVTGPRQQIDVLPTLLDLAGAEVVGGTLPGKSLFSQVPDDRTLYHSCWRSHRCVASRKEERKFIDHYRDLPAQVFDLDADPKESHSIPTPGAEIEAMRAEVRGWRSRVNGRYSALHEMYLEHVQRPDDSPALATWGGKIDLLGCTAENPVVVPAGDVWVDCRWRARDTMKMAWRVSTRIEGSFKAEDAEARPLDGLLPTFQWRPGWAVDDHFRVSVPADAPPGEAVIKVGWERYGGDEIGLDAGATAPVDHDRVEVARVTIVSPEFGVEPPHSDPPLPEPGAGGGPPPGTAPMFHRDATSDRIVMPGG